MDKKNYNEIIDGLTDEAREGAITGDSFSLYFNDDGYSRFESKLQHVDGVERPTYKIDITKIHYGTFVKNLIGLMPFVKGFSLNVSVPQRRRRLVSFLNETIISYIDHHEIDNTSTIISELTANAEKSNLEDVIKRFNLNSGVNIPDVLRERREEVIEKAVSIGKKVEIVWKFSPQIYKFEVRNNSLISEYGLSTIKNKIKIPLNNIADGYADSKNNSSGAGLGLYYVNFFSSQIKEKYGFETIFRVFNTDKSTSATLTVFFEKK